MPYPTDITVQANDKEEKHWSGEFKCWLPWAINLGWKGVFIHEDITSGNLSHGNSHGCINLVSNDAKRVYSLVNCKTRILIEYKW